LRKFLFLIAVTVLTFIPVTARAHCEGVPDPIGSPTPSGDVCGTVKLKGYTGSYFVDRTAGNTSVKICPAGASWSSYTCSTTYTSRVYGPTGDAIDAFRYPAYRSPYASEAYFDFYAWSTTTNWGSETKPIRRISIGAGLQGISLSIPPRPNSPGPVYPSGTNVPNSYLVRWDSGIDTDRKPYPVTYEIWFKHWAYEDNEPSQWTLSRADMPCQDNGGGPNANNECTTFVVGPMTPGNWRWYVVANLNVSQVVYYPNTWFTTKSGTKYFFQPN
jgi:hypothetical protein